MRDPAPPRRNPFFDRESDVDPDDPGIGWRDSVDGAAASGFAALIGLAEGLADAQPDAAEHLVAAAHEVVLTVKVLVDATEAVLADQRATMAARRIERERAEPEGPEAEVMDLSVVRPAGDP